MGQVTRASSEHSEELERWTGRTHQCSLDTLLESRANARQWEILGGGSMVVVKVVCFKGGM